MGYATRQNMIDRFGEEELVQLTDRKDPPARVIDDGVLTKALEDASAFIDGYLQGRYTLPLTNVPTTLERIACDIARYYLYEDAVTDAVKQRYQDATRFLADVSAGRIDLGLDSANNAVTVSNTPEYSAPDRVFTAETLDEY